VIPEHLFTNPQSGEVILEGFVIRSLSVTNVTLDKVVTRSAPTLAVIPRNDHMYLLA
jgi:hypothetical protein